MRGVQKLWSYKNVKKLIFLKCFIQGEFLHEILNLATINFGELSLYYKLQRKCIQSENLHSADPSDTYSKIFFYSANNPLINDPI